MTFPAPTDLLPHREPFVFVDEIVALEPGRSARARWTLPDDADFLRGHFPGRPIMPGVLIIEALAQTGALAVLSEEDSRGALALFAGIDRARFRRPVVPGDTLELAMTLTRRRGPLGEGEGTVHVGGELACEATLRFAITPRET